uniref:Uncharacterized protein n=1 Tax=Arundo donax TaxID=35708 RepID=A0A0A9CH73_ARUDO
MVWRGAGRGGRSHAAAVRRTWRRRGAAVVIWGRGVELRRGARLGYL